MIAIIPARGGSKGLPNKNIKNLLGKPMIAYTIIEALKSSYIDEVIVSTDSKEIEQIAKEYGATSHFIRPEYLSGDNSNAIDNYIYTIDRLNNEFDYSINEFIVLQPTSPLRTREDIDKSMKIFYDNNADSVISYTKEPHPISWHKYINDDLSFENIFEDNLQNRQNNKSSYYPNGAIFVFRYNIIKEKQYYSNQSYAYIMSRTNSVDIDTIDDFEYAQFLLNKRTNAKK